MASIQETSPIQISGPSEPVLLSVEENGYAHLFTYEPGVLPLTRLTYGEWSDITPAVSPDGLQAAFASNRNGFWDLYLMDLNSGEVAQLTDSPAYDSSPSWSPDGEWLVFDTYIDQDLEIAILSVNDPAQALIRLTKDQASDHSPVWSPNGRRIAFVSTRSGDSDIWLADLDLMDGSRFQNISNTPQVAENFPVWDPTGTRLAWASSAQSVGYNGIYLWENGSPSTAPVDENGNSTLSVPNHPPRWIGEGERVAWNRNGDALTAAFSTPNQQYLASFDLNGEPLIAPMPLPGRVRGLAWSTFNLQSKLSESFSQAAVQTPALEWLPAITPVENFPARRWSLVRLAGVQAPYPQLHDMVDESFSALRQRILDDCGWDALAGLENAYVPLTTSLEPGYSDDWLYTGRAFSINPLMANAGWMVTIREDFAGQTYWRLYLRCTSQDGSQGEPIQETPWDLNSRYELDPRVYEQGGRYGPVPAGYWVDVTMLASAYGWERLPALSNWRSFYGGARFTEFVMTGGLDWYSAMLELYPPGALLTPTRVLPPTLTPTRTPVPTSTPGPSRTPRPTVTPSATRGPTSTPTITNTSAPSPTPPTVIP